MALLQGHKPFRGQAVEVVEEEYARSGGASPSEEVSHVGLSLSHILREDL